MHESLQLRIIQKVFLKDLKGTVRVSNPGGGEIFCTPPYWPWGPPSLL